MGLLGKLLAAPVRIINVPIKATEAAFGALCDERPRIKRNALDDIGDVIEDATDKILKGGDQWKT